MTGDLVGAARDAFGGQLVTAGDEGYDEARRTLYGGVDLRPLAVVYPTDADEVGRVVAFARDHGVELAVRSGGHSAARHSMSDGGIVLDVSRLKGIEIDAAGRTAWAGSGVTAGEFTAAAAEHGLAVPFGDTGSVGLGGITLGGGVGFLARKYGLTIDHLIGAEIVTADGSVLPVDSSSHPELFWALRGGGGNFGVATRFRYSLVPVDEVVGGMLILPATAETIAGWMAESAAAPEELTSIANIMPAPPMPFLPAEWHGKLVLMALVCFAGPADAGERAVAPFRALATPIVDMVKPLRYAEMFGPEDEDYHPIPAARTMFLGEVDKATAETIMERLSSSDAAFRVTQLRELGGAVSRVPADATAYAHRASRVMVNLAVLCDSVDEVPARQVWVDEYAAQLGQGDEGAYVGFVGAEGAAGVRHAYPAATYARLAEVKARYDPANLFRLNQNVEPAAG